MPIYVMLRNSVSRDKVPGIRMKTFRNFWPKEDQMIFGCLYTIESDKAVAPTLACRAISDAAHEAMHCKSASEV